MENVNVVEVVKTWPTAPGVDGWFFADEASESLNIETRIDENEDVFKRVKLSKGRTAILNELTGKQTNTAATLAGKNPDKMLNAYIALSTVITDKDGNKVPFVMEDLDGWKAKDTNRLQVACQQLNF